MLTRLLIPVCLLTATLGVRGVSAQKIDPTEKASVSLPLMHLAPTIDGIITEEEWAEAVRVVGFSEFGSGFLTPRGGTFWFGCDGKRVYVAMKTETPPIGSLLSRVRKKDGPVWNDDAIEVWLAPHEGKKSGDRRYFQFIGNPLGTIFDIAFEAGGASGFWEGDWEFKNSIGEGVWSSEASVTLDSLGVDAEDVKREWRVHVCRDWQQPSTYSSWAPSMAAFANRDTMTRVRWDEAAPVTQVLSLGEIFDGKVDFRVAASNPGNRPIDAKVHLEVQPTNQPWFSTEKTLTLQPGSKQVVDLQRNVERGKYSAAIRVTSPDGSKEYFNRSFGWDKKPSHTWTVVRQEAKAVDFTASYYPYYRKVRARVDFSGLSAAANVHDAVFVLKAKGGDKPLAQGTLKGFKSNAGEILLDTPDLKTGAYVVTAQLRGGQGVPENPFVQTFERKVWEWEHNSVGCSRQVIPPFTPLKVKGQTVDCLLRSHAMNGSGLWDQVVASGKAILAAPMRFEVKSRGTVAPLRSSSSRFIEKSADRVTSECSLTGGPLKAKVTSEFDYDGMMKVSLDVSSSKKEEVQSLDLLIPLREDIASLLHVCSDGVRANHAGSIPAGEGVVWDSTKAVRYDLYGSFVPYVWLGGETRGLCWFADTDRDWELDDKLPALDLVRQKGIVTLRVHFVNKPSRLARNRHIVFGLQATPVKPLPDGWRSWSFYGKYPNTEEMVILGSCPYWGSESDYGDVYPRRRDFTIFEKFREARHTGNRDWAFLDEWVKGYEDQSRVENRKIHVQAGMWSMRPGVRIIPYTNARGGCSGEEGRSFAAETWFEPVPSYQDFALWYYKKMMDLEIDGIYLDNTYAAANRDTISGDAYLRPDGNLQPSCGIFSMRNLIKRIAVMYRAAGKEPLTVVHMTNGYIIPALSFATIALDWEDKYGAADFQDKFSEDFIRTESIGLQAGLVPLVLGGVITQDEKEQKRISRTAFGVAAVHEIKIWADGRTYDLAKCHQSLYDFGYGQPDCKVYPYWEGNQPVQVGGLQAKALVLSRPAKALVLVTDFAEGGEGTFTVDTKRLGLKGSFEAKDAETGEPLPVEQGKVRFALKKHDFRMVVVE
ncbi:MAG: hypothetical protein HY318_14375 [Armatimonadetes bacterium]|nr:hypothetical protein [Armatimonadota bacterium]